MTEDKWLQAEKPTHLLHVLHRPSSRKLRLFAVACCQHNAELFADSRHRLAIQTAEFQAEGKTNEKQLANAMLLLDEVTEELCEEDIGARIPVCLLANELHVQDAADVSFAVAEKASFENFGFDGLVDELQFEHSGFVREIFGNPFRPVSFDPRWRTSDVVDVARGIYEDKAFERMPILADALMDAGCEDVEIIGHCRSDGPHVRGCWVVDWVLGKA